MRYFIGFLVSIGLLILLIILLVGGGGDDNKKVPTTEKPLSSYAATDSNVVMVIDGPVIANEEHRQIRVTVSSQRVLFEQVNGYDGSVVNSKSYANTENSYITFLKALSTVGYTKGTDDDVLKDERGYCPGNNRYIFALNQDGKNITRFWTSDCENPRTYNGARNATVNLFQQQVPDYSELSSDIDNI